MMLNQRPNEIPFAIWIYSLILMFTCGPLQPLCLCYGGNLLWDRFILKVQDTPFTQRDLEQYLLVKTYINHATPHFSLSQEHWSDALSEFRLDMMVAQDAKKLSRFFASDETIQSHLNLVQSRLTSFPILYKHLYVHPDTLRVYIGLYLQVKEFKQAKNQSRDIRQSLDKKLHEVHWFEELEQRLITTLYEGAEVYEPLAYDIGTFER